MVDTFNFSLSRYNNINEAFRTLVPFKENSEGEKID